MNNIYALYTYAITAYIISVSRGHTPDGKVRIMNKVEITASKIFEYASGCVEFGMQPDMQTILNYAWYLYYYGATDQIEGNLAHPHE